MMKQIVQSAKTGKLGLKEVPAPRVKSGHLLVRTRASLISAGTERMVIDFAKKSLAGKAKARPDLVRKVLDKAKRDGIAATFRAVMARLDEPLPLGYSAAGEVVEVGSGLEGAFRVGQRVALAGSGLANHAELNVVPAALAAPIPDDVTDDEASFGTLAAIAMHGVRNLAPGLGDVVAVLGVGLVGQLTIRLLALSGARPLALDYDPARLELAKQLGAEAAFNLANTAGLMESVQFMTHGRGCDGILVCAATDSSEPLEMAAAMARDRARIVMVGKTGTEFPFADFMKKELSLIVSRSYGPGRYDDAFEHRGIKYPVGFVRWTESENLAECVRLMSPSLAQRLDVRPLITHRFAFDKAEVAYELVSEGKAPHMGVVLTYADHALPRRPALIKASVAAKASGECVLGVIGAGAFARTVLLPELKRIPDCRFETLVTQRGMSAEHGQKSFGFAHASTEIEAILGNPAINAVLIATRHSSHAELTARALEAGKSVLVEKPLALSREELTRVIEARNGSTGFLLVGFNRRFAPLTLKLKAHLAAINGPKFIIIRVNAGGLPPESWVNAAEEGGGRVLGEMCHFVDLAQALIGAPIVSVQADSAGGPIGRDDVSASLHFTDGSLATLAYTAQGDTAYSKERIEAFAGGTVATIDNFRDFTLVSNGKSVSSGSKLGQDKGHRGQLEAFVAAVAKGGTPPAPEEDLIANSLATIMVLDSLRTGERIAI
jgi:predicted dehydrogenase/threonine dehydrogenase-like Zn-dependent dehydrogenase